MVVCQAVSCICPVSLSTLLEFASWLWYHDVKRFNVFMGHELRISKAYQPVDSGSPYIIDRKYNSHKRRSRELSENTLLISVRKATNCKWSPTANHELSTYLLGPILRKVSSIYCRIVMNSGMLRITTFRSSVRENVKVRPSKWTRSQQAAGKPYSFTNNGAFVISSDSGSLAKQYSNM